MTWNDPTYGEREEYDTNIESDGRGDDLKYEHVPLKVVRHMVSIDRTAWDLMQRERVSTENEIALLREQRDKLAKACRMGITIASSPENRCPFGRAYAPNDHQCDCNYHAMYRRMIDAIAYAEGKQ